ncbi:MAG TPA: single-stranded DNA-binding protein [bacterium]|nr:single-stranded DNA-binding protein [bacterium]
MALGKGTVNKVILLGRLGRDPEMRHTPSGAAVTTLNIATDFTWKDQEGNKREQTEWHRVVLWRRLAEVANDYLKKGQPVYIEGRLQTRSWNDKDNITRYSTEIVAEAMQLMGGITKADRRDSGPEEEAPPEEDQNSSIVSDQEPPEDDLPF